MKDGLIGYERIVEAMIFGVHYIIDEKDNWIKTKMTRKEFLEKYLPRKKSK